MQKTYHKLRLWARWKVLRTICVNRYQCGNNGYALHIWISRGGQLPLNFETNDDASQFSILSLLKYIQGNEAEVVSFMKIHRTRS